MHKTVQFRRLMGEERMSELARRRRIRIKPSHVILVLVLTAFAIFCMLPLYYMVIAALKPLEEQLIFPPRFYVRNITFKNISNLFKSFNSSEVPFSRYIFNSIFTAGSAVALSVLACSMAAYALSKIRVKGRNIIFSVVVASLMFSAHVTQIPTFIICKNIGLVDNYFALILPKIAVAYNMFLLKQFADQIPDPLIEAATIDGAGEWKCYWKIIMPMLRPAWATVIVLSFVSNWNDYFSALIFIQSDQLKTLPLAIQLITQSGTVATLGTQAAATLFMTLPTILIYVLMQSNVLKSMAHSGIKG